MNFVGEKEDVSLYIRTLEETHTRRWSRARESGGSNRRKKKLYKKGVQPLGVGLGVHRGKKYHRVVSGKVFFYCDRAFYLLSS